MSPQGAADTQLPFACGAEADAAILAALHRSGTQPGPEPLPTTLSEPNGPTAPTVGARLLSSPREVIQSPSRYQGNLTEAQHRRP